MTSFPNNYPSFGGHRSRFQELCGPRQADQAAPDQDFRSRIEARRPAPVRHEFLAPRGPAAALRTPNVGRNLPARQAGRLSSAAEIEGSRALTLEKMVKNVEVSATQINALAAELLGYMVHGFDQFALMGERLTQGVQNLGGLQDDYLAEVRHAIRGVQAHPEDLELILGFGDHVNLAIVDGGRANAAQVIEQAERLKTLLEYQSETFDEAFKGLRAAGQGVLENYTTALKVLNQQAAEELTRTIAEIEKDMEVDRQAFEQHIASRKLTIEENNEEHKREMEAREKALTEHMAHRKAALDELNARAHNNLEQLKVMHAEAHAERVDNLELTKENHRAHAEQLKNDTFHIFRLATRVLLPLPFLL